MLTNKEVRKKLRLEYIALILLVFGIAFAMLSSLNIPSWTVQSFDSGTVPIAPNSSNEHSFYTSFGPDLKKVEVIVDNGPWGMPSMWGDCVWIKHSFQMSLLGGQGEYVEITTDTPPRVDYTFNVPSSWNTLGGVRISNPENQPVAVTVEVIFHRQTINSFWVTATIIGLIVAVIGIILLFISFRTEEPPPAVFLPFPKSFLCQS
jgi:hypothetical protein